MQTRDIRRANFLQLASRYPRIRHFCEAAGLEPSYYSQIKASSKALGDKLARELERRLGLPRGWFDLPQPEGEPISDELSLAYTLQTLPAPLRESVKRLVLDLARGGPLPAESQRLIAPFQGRIPHDRANPALPAERLAAAR